MTVDMRADAESPNAGDAPVDYPLFAMSTHKFIILSLCTFGIYERYWSYKNWEKIRDLTGADITPIWRVIFNPIWSFSLFGKIRDVAATNRIRVWWSAGLLGTMFFILELMWRLPDPWWWICFASTLTAVPVLQTAQHVNRLHNNGKSAISVREYSTANIITIIVGGLVVLLALVGTFLPE